MFAIYPSIHPTVHPFWLLYLSTICPFRIMEAVLIGLVTTLSVFLLSTFFGTCVPLIEGNGGQNFVNSTQSYFCPTGITFTEVTFSKTYNDMATLAFNSEEDAIKQLFHQNGTI